MPGAIGSPVGYFGGDIDYVFWGFQGKIILLLAVSVLLFPTALVGLSCTDCIVPKRRSPAEESMLVRGVTYRYKLVLLCSQHRTSKRSFGQRKSQSASYNCSVAGAADRKTCTECVIGKRRCIVIAYFSVQHRVIHSSLFTICNF